MVASGWSGSLCSVSRIWSVLWSSPTPVSKPSKVKEARGSVSISSASLHWANRAAGLTWSVATALPVGSSTVNSHTPMPSTSRRYSPVTENSPAGTRYSRVASSRALASQTPNVFWNWVAYTVYQLSPWR